MSEDLDEIAAERADMARLHNIETGDHTPLVLKCDDHGRYIPVSLLDQCCPLCDYLWDHTPIRHTLPPLKGS